MSDINLSSSIEGRFEGGSREGEERNQGPSSISNHIQSLGEVGEQNQAQQHDEGTRMSGNELMGGLNEVDLQREQETASGGSGSEQPPIQPASQAAEDLSSSQDQQSLSQVQEHQSEIEVSYPVDTQPEETVTSESLPLAQQATTSESSGMDLDQSENQWNPTAPEPEESMQEVEASIPTPGTTSTSSPASTSSTPTQPTTSYAQADTTPQAPGAYPATSQPSRTTTTTPRVIQYFRLPYLHPDGSPALLEFSGSALPSMPSGSAPYTPTRPMFVPRGASPLPFGFIFDAPSNTAWSITEIPGQPTSGTSSTSGTSGSAAAASNPADDPRNIAFVTPTSNPSATTSTPTINPDNPRLIAGPPFHVMIDFNFGGGQEAMEELDPKRAEKFCEKLEKADAELRERMLRVELGELGIYGSNSDGGNALGCAVCLEQYMDDDRPAWLDGGKATDSEVVCVPCEGHHTLHRGCLKEWLSNSKPSKWACPFCRNPILDDEGRPSNLSGKKKLEAEAKRKGMRSLRDEVRFRERRNGWRCDARACGCEYPDPELTSNGNDKSESKLLVLKPCKHEIHLDCLLTEIRVQDGLLDLDVDEDEDDDEEDQEMGKENSIVDSLSLSETEVEKLTTSVESGQDIVMSETTKPSNDSGFSGVDGKGGTEVVTKGKWISCPCCRKEAWAEFPVRKRARKSASNSPRM